MDVRGVGVKKKVLVFGMKNEGCMYERVSLRILAIVQFLLVVLSVFIMEMDTN